MTTMNDCLLEMAGNPDENARWEYLALFLRELALQQGVDLGRTVEDDDDCV